MSTNVNVVNVSSVVIHEGVVHIFSYAGEDAIRLKFDTEKDLLKFKSEIVCNITMNDLDDEKIQTVSKRIAKIVNSEEA